MQWWKTYWYSPYMDTRDVRFECILTECTDACVSVVYIGYCIHGLLEPCLL